MQFIIEKKKNTKDHGTERQFRKFHIQKYMLS